MASGTGARLSRESLVHHAEFVSAIEVRKIDGVRAISAADEPLITMASAVDTEWVAPTSREVVHEYDASSKKLRATRLDKYGALVLKAHPMAPDPVAAAPILLDIWRARERNPEEVEMLARLKFAAAGARAAARDAFVDVLVQLSEAVLSAGVDREWDIVADAGSDPVLRLSQSLRAKLDRAAPPTLTVPSGRDRVLSYRDDGSVFAAVKLQELFGLAETPRVYSAQ